MGSNRLISTMLLALVTCASGCLGAGPRAGGGDAGMGEGVSWDACAGDPWAGEGVGSTFCSLETELSLLDPAPWLFRAEGASLEVVVRVNSGSDRNGGAFVAGLDLPPGVEWISGEREARRPVADGEVVRLTGRARALQPGAFVLGAYAAYVGEDGTTGPGLRTMSLLGVMGNATEAVLFRPDEVARDVELALVETGAGVVEARLRSDVRTAYRLEASHHPDFSLHVDGPMRGVLDPGDEVAIPIRIDFRGQSGEGMLGLHLQAFFEPHVVPVGPSVGRWYDVQDGEPTATYEREPRTPATHGSQAPPTGCDDPRC